MKAKINRAVMTLGLAMTLGGCGIVGHNNEAIGKWKLTGIKPNTPFVTSALLRLVTQMASTEVGELLVITDSKMTMGTPPYTVGLKIIKFKVHKNEVTAYIERKGVLLGGMRLTFSDHGKRMILPQKAFLYQYQKLS